MIEAQKEFSAEGEFELYLKNEGGFELATPELLRQMVDDADEEMARNEADGKTTEPFEVEFEIRKR